MPIYLTLLAFVFFLVSNFIQITGPAPDLFFNKFTAWLGFVFFYLYGGLVYKQQINIKRPLINIGLVGVGLFITVLGDYLSTRTFQYFSVPLMAIGLFNLLITINFKLDFNRLIRWLAGLTYGIYLIHTLVVKVMLDYLGFHFDNLHINPYLYSLINYCLVLGVSIVIVTLIKKVPKLRMIIGE